MLGSEKLISLRIPGLWWCGESKGGEEGWDAMVSTIRSNQ